MGWPGGGYLGRGERAPERAVRAGGRRVGAPGVSLGKAIFRGWGMGVHRGRVERAGDLSASLGRGIERGAGAEERSVLLWLLAGVSW